MTRLRTELTFALYALIFVLIVVFGTAPAIIYAVAAVLRHLVNH